MPRAVMRDNSQIASPFLTQLSTNLGDVQFAGMWKETWIVRCVWKVLWAVDRVKFVFHVQSERKRTYKAFCSDGVRPEKCLPGNRIAIGSNGYSWLAFHPTCTAVSFHFTEPLAL